MSLIIIHIQFVVVFSMLSMNSDVVKNKLIITNTKGVGLLLYTAAVKMIYQRLCLGAHAQARYTVVCLCVCVCRLCV